MLVIMKAKNLLILLTSVLLVCSCTKTTPTVEPEPDPDPVDPGQGGGGETPPPSGPTKVIVAKHTLKDSNPPITIGGKGQKVSEDTWNSFRNAADSKFKGNYNYTYTAYSGGYLTQEKFTKNGYYMQSSAGRLYYERKSGNTFYNYISAKEGYLRQETTLNLESKYIGRIQNEIYTHMFDFSNYEYDDYDGTYRYITTGFGSNVKFQNGYLTELYYALGANIFRIEYSFETTIDIPESYYYKN